MAPTTAAQAATIILDGVRAEQVAHPRGRRRAQARRGRARQPRGRLRPWPLAVQPDQLGRGLVGWMAPRSRRRLRRRRPKSPGSSSRSATTSSGRRRVCPTGVGSTSCATSASAPKRSTGWSRAALRGEASLFYPGGRAETASGHLGPRRRRVAPGRGVVVRGEQRAAQRRVGLGRRLDDHPP